MKLWLLSFHLVAMVMWIGGLTTLGRLLAYHAVEPPSVRPTLRRIEARANFLCAWPGALLSLGTGALLVRMNGYAWLRVSLWMQAKLALVALLVLVHLGVTRAQRRVARQDPNATVERVWSALSWLVTLLLLAIVLLSVQRPMTGGG